MKPETRFSVRPFELHDIPKIAAYFTAATPADLDRMGVNTATLPSAEKFEAGLRELRATPIEKTKAFYLIWQVDGKAIGFSSLKNIAFGESGEMHLHMWDPESRGKGYGAPLFCLSAVDFYDRFQLKQVHCEPKAANPMPNKMLSKVGFPLVKTYVGASSELSLVCELNRYEIPKKTAEAFLKTFNA